MAAMVACQWAGVAIKTASMSAPIQDLAEIGIGFAGREFSP
jgi:hypothetical protein